MSPVRVQRRRTKGWRMPAGAVYVGPGSPWGNPFGPLGSTRALRRVPAVKHPDQVWEYEGRISAHGMTHPYVTETTVTRCEVSYMSAEEAVECYRALLHGDGRWPLDFAHNGRSYPHLKNIAQLAGRNLVCWCPLDVACHVDVLLEYANPASRAEVAA